MRITLLLLIICCYSCNNERTLLLPEIENAEVTEVLDMSPAYIFYDETQPDSTLLNRKNLIITTNWLVNVDKRLTLRQAIPKIILMQEKKRNSELHKNEDAKNYFTCNDTKIENLGFLEFTDVSYIHESSSNFDKKSSSIKLQKAIIIEVNSLNEIKLFTDSSDNPQSKTTNSIELIVDLQNIFQTGNSMITPIILNFNKNISFQDYISIKSELIKLKSEQFKIENNEFIY
ncbi:hypothetical protein [Winogradskyella bathintestinalis]|uniref:Lipoprotein n=1 Tax=Winogradskyella bathintestinalis TaxID=3035208 RepID=A0ABT7ZUU5_9FLAO|nr:hypothetical protein [Winogradskyella bathintestinalis]MDN3492814.1 hypothetical protein [Winogradskyella bathintestinalis]